MKYIRTKDGISKTEEDIIEYVIKPNNINFKQADTIEELCDEFVMIKEKPQVIYSNLTYNDLAIARLRDKNSSVEIYGAIWTDKGLIYAAKMNDKGELELL